MLDHISIGVYDLERSIEFYDAVLTALGYERLWRMDDAAGYGKPGEKDEPFAIKRQTSGVSPNERFHIAFRAPSRAAAAAFHAAAIPLGAIDDGAPGVHSEYGADYYAAFVIDPNGYRLEAVYHG